MSTTNFRQGSARAWLAAALLASLLVSNAASTARAQSDDDRLDKAWDAAAALQEELLTDALQATMNNMAYQAAVTNVCDGFDLDVGKFSKAFADLQDAAADAQKADFSEDDIRAWRTAMAVRLGLATGIFIAEGQAKPTDFCANATELKKDASAPNYWE